MGFKQHRTWFEDIMLAIAFIKCVSDLRIVLLISTVIIILAVILTGLSRSFYQQPPIGRPRRASWHADTGYESGIDEFFSVRVGALERAVEECRHLADPESDGAIKGAWLLTE